MCDVTTLHTFNDLFRVNSNTAIRMS